MIPKLVIRNDSTLKRTKEDLLCKKFHPSLNFSPKVTILLIQTLKLKKYETRIY